MGQVPNPKNYRKDEKMRKRNIKINVFINEEEQIRFKNKVKKLGLSQSSYIRKIIKSTSYFSYITMNNFINMILE